MPRMDLEKTAACLAALGNAARLRVFALLVQAGPEGLSVSALRNALGMPASTLAHHLRGMVDAGLVQQERRSSVSRAFACSPMIRWPRPSGHG